MREDLKGIALNRAKQTARSLGYSLTPMAETDLKIFIENGIDKMTSFEYLSVSDNQRLLNNIDVLINRMQIDSKSRSLNESMDFKSFSNARARVCPLWPFC